MELLKLIILIVCSALLLFLVLPAIAVFFIFRAKDLNRSARWAKAVVIVFIILGIILAGVIVWDTVDLLINRESPHTPTVTEPSTQMPSQATTLPQETTEATEKAEIIGATISTEQLDGQWIAIAEPAIPEDENYTYATDGGYYLFTPDGSFTFTQVKLAKAGTWQALPGYVTYEGTYVLDGDLLTLHYTGRTEWDGTDAAENAPFYEMDESETVSMLINQSCTEMCVLTPDHPKLGELFIFQKGRGTDPVNALLIALNAEY